MWEVRRKGHHPYSEPKDEEVVLPPVLDKTLERSVMNPYFWIILGAIIFGAAVDFGLI